jgi:hypothetical protein
MPAVPDDINEIFDAICGAKHPLITRRISPLTGVPFSSTGAPGAGSYATTPFGSWKATANLSGLAVPLPIFAGERIVNVRAYVSCGATDSIESHLYRNVYVPGGGPAQVELGSMQATTGHAGVIEELTYTGIDEPTLSYSAVYLLELYVAAFANAPTVWAIELDTDLL